MIQHASTEQTPHLPPAPAGASYRLRRIGRDQYVTTGAFPIEAPDATAANLCRAAVLVFDCDLADFLARQAPQAERRELASQIKKQFLPTLDAPTLNQHLQALYQYLCAALAYATGRQQPTAIVCSGYGFHVYYWLPERDGYGPDLQAVASAERGAVAHLNQCCGWDCADPNVKDAGTRIMRIPGTQNLKHQQPRSVDLLYLPDPANVLQDWRRFQAYDSPRHAASANSAQNSASGFAAFPTPQQQAEITAANNVAGKQRQKKQAAPVDFGELFAKSQEEADQALLDLLRKCPFFLWAQENPQSLRRESWRGAATNIAAVAGEYGRRVFHEFSALDPDRYDFGTCEKTYSDALDSARSHGPMTYETLARNGDWPGTPPQGVKAPASWRFLGKTADLIRACPEIVLDPKSGKPLRTRGNLRKILRTDERYGARLQWNEMSKAAELDGSEITDATFGTCGEYLEDVYHVDFPEEWIASAIPGVAQERPYHPVRRYLDSLEWDGTSRFRLALTEVLGVEPSALYEAFLRKFLIGAAARALHNDPEGYKFDCALILKGEQRRKKSMFFNVLAGAYFADSFLDLRDKDSYMILQRAWFVELAELEGTLNRSQMAAVKSFMSAKVDTYRPPFGRAIVVSPRRCVICGTTNEDHFLFDPTGDRRFWIIETGTSEVNADALRAMRDQLWAEAVHAYRQGETSYLDDEQESQRSDHASKYRQEEPWESIVCRWIEDKKVSDTSIEQILIECIQKEAKDWRVSDYQTLSKILRKTGFHRYRIMLEGKREYRFRRLGTAYPAAEKSGSTDLTAGSGTSNVVPFAEVQRLWKQS